MKTSMEKLREKTMMLNKYSREVINEIGSPYRINEYAKLRIRGLSKEAALEKVKRHS